MTDYTELVKCLRNHSNSNADCDSCPYYDAVARGYTTCSEELTEQAADAIEELNKLLKKVHDAHNEGYDVGYWAGRRDYEPKWIPVTERLPEHLTSVIVHRKDGGIFMWEYFDTSPTDECWIDDSMNVYSFYDVTHWMPLPKPPKEETLWRD